MIQTAAKRTSRARFAVCLIIALTLVLPSVSLVRANPATESASANDDGPVTLTQPSVTIPTDGSFAATVTVAIDRPTSYLESR
ncbi:MAG: hypothetical protein Q8M66_09410, partial [Actinomycetota bacterium]|nr:hypothetical protein [Actinomycetota bacterium]